MPAAPWRGRRVRQADAELGVDVLDEAGAVEAGRGGATVHVGHAEVLLGDGEQAGGVGGTVHRVRGELLGGEAGVPGGVGGHLRLCGLTCRLGCCGGLVGGADLLAGRGREAVLRDGCRDHVAGDLDGLRLRLRERRLGRGAELRALAARRERIGGDRQRADDAGATAITTTLATPPRRSRRVVERKGFRADLLGDVGSAGGRGLRDVMSPSRRPLVRCPWWNVAVRVGAKTYTSAAHDKCCRST